MCRCRVPDRFLERRAGEAIDRARQELATPILDYGPVVEVLLEVAGTPAAVTHGLGRIPDGYLPVLEIGGNVQAYAFTTWTTDLAWLVASANNTRARVTFVAVREVRNG